MSEKDIDFKKELASVWKHQTFRAHVRTSDGGSFEGIYYHRYSLMIWGREICDSPVLFTERERKSGKNPLIALERTGQVKPQWMVDLAGSINVANFTELEDVCGLIDLAVKRIGQHQPSDQYHAMCAVDEIRKGNDEF